MVVQQATAALRQIDGWIAAEEQLEAERRRGQETRQPPPEWWIERGLNPDNLVAVHCGDCWNPGKRHVPATRQQALDALRNQVSPCLHCRPDSALGFLE